MNLNRVLRSMRRGLRSALLVGLTLGLLTAVYSLLTVKPSYRAANTVLFQVAGMDKVADPSVAVTYATTLASSYTSMMTQPGVVQPLAKEMDIPAPELEAGLQVTPPKNNLTSTIAYSAPDEQQAKDVVTAVGKRLEQAVDTSTDKVQGQPRIAVVDQQVVTYEEPGSGGSPVSAVLKGIVVALLATLGWLVARALFDQKVRSRADLEEASDASVIAHVRQDQDAAIVGRVLPFLGLGERATLLMASSTDKEDLSGAVVATAKALAAEGPVLLIDADLRKGGVSRALDATGPGLSEYLSTRTTLDALVRDADGLSVLGCGAVPPNPAELLAGPRLQQLLAEAGQRHHLVLVHGTGLLDHSDAALVAGHCGATVLLVGSGSITQAQVRESLQLLHSVGARVQGQVLVG